MAVTEATRLGCGRDIDDVWATVGTPPSAHEQACPYCRTARANLADLAAATEELTAADRADPLLRIPAQLMSDILAIARTEVRRGRSIPLQRPPRPSTGIEPTADGAAEELTVSELAIATVVRRACDQVPGVEAGRCNVTMSDPQPPASRPAVPADPGDGAGGEPVDITIEMEVSISHSTAIGTLSELRRDVVEAVAAHVGVTVSRIDIHVRDVHDA